MTVVLLGTNPYPFSRLLKAIEVWARRTGTQVIVQSGNTPPVKDPIECHPFVEHACLLKWIREATVVVTQGGFGSICDCLKEGAKIVAVPRRIELSESVDDQVELVSALADEGLVVPVYDIAELPNAIEKAERAPKRIACASKLPEHVAKTIEQMISET